MPDERISVALSLEASHSPRTFFSCCAPATTDPKIKMKIKKDKIKYCVYKIE
jgi:hypothetical protein